VPLELDPPQPDPVARAVEQLLAEPGRRPDPWWAAGLEDGLRGGDGPAAQDARRRAGVVEP
jgi:hypothetical protein